MSVLGDFIQSLIEVVAPEPAPYTVQAPSCLMTNLTTNEDRWVFHMTNWTGNKYERNLVNDYYLSPVENIQIKFRIPEGRSVTKISPFIDTPFEKKTTDQHLEILDENPFR